MHLWKKSLDSVVRSVVKKLKMQGKSVKLISTKTPSSIDLVSTMK